MKFQYRDFEVFVVLYLQANRGFHKIITQARINIFHAFFVSFTSQGNLLEQVGFES